MNDAMKIEPNKQKLKYICNEINMSLFIPKKWMVFFIIISLI